MSYIVGILILLNGILFYLYLKFTKKVNKIFSKFQILENFIVFNPKGIKEGKFSKDDIIIGLIDNKIIIADIEENKPNRKLGIYLSNGKIKTR